MASARPAPLPSGEIALHRHAAPYATIVLTGSYLEAGDAGRHRVEPGEVLLHAPFSMHRDLVERRTTSVLDLPLPMTAALLPRRGRVLDPDRIARLAERSANEASELLLDLLVPDDTTREREIADQLGDALTAEEPPAIGAWAAEHGRARESLSRQFQRLYGVDAAAYRATARARRAWRLIVFGDDSLAAVAQATGHADQAHMTRAVRALTGRTPGAWRSHRFKTERPSAV